MDSPHWNAHVWICPASHRACRQLDSLLLMLTPLMAQDSLAMVLPIIPNASRGMKRIQDTEARGQQGKDVVGGSRCHYLYPCFELSDSCSSPDHRIGYRISLQKPTAGGLRSDVRQDRPLVRKKRLEGSLTSLNFRDLRDFVRAPDIAFGGWEWHS